MKKQRLPCILRYPLWKLACFLLGLLCVFGTYAFSESLSVLNLDWQYKKVLRLPELPDNIPVEHVAVFDFSGKASPDGSDIRIVTPEGKEIPYTILSTGPGNVYRLAFPAVEKTCYVYYGNPHAKKPLYTWKPQRGLIVRVYNRCGDSVYNWKDAKKVIDNSIQEKLIGESFWKKIWDGVVNPFSGEKNVVKIYTGYFYVNHPREYGFATSSAGPSFLCIDDSLAASWPGWHRAEPFVSPEHAGSVSLKEGLHKLTYYHIGKGGQEISVAAMQHPEKKDRFSVIPESFFLPVVNPEVERTEKKGENCVSEFSWQNTFYLKRDQWELLTFKFWDRSFSKTKILKRQWNFGDGQTSNEENSSHTYLKPGEYTVSLKIEDERGCKDAVSLKVNVEQDYSIPRIYPKRSREYFEEFSEFDLKKLPAGHLLILAHILQSYNRIQGAYLCYNVLRSRELDSGQKRKFSIISAELAEKTGKYGEAERIYKDAFSQFPCAEIILKLGNLYVSMGEPEKAEKQFSMILENPDSSRTEQKMAEIGLGDVARAEGNYEKAKAVYTRHTDEKTEKIKKYAFAQSVIYYLKQKDFSTALEEIEKWGQEVPLSKIDGHWSILKARAYIIRKDYESALRELDYFREICLDKENPYFIWALYLTAETYQFMGNKKKAKEYYEKVVAEFPGGSLATAASKKLSDL